MRKEEGGKRGKKKMEERQKDWEKEGGELKERTEERTEEGTEETEERIEDTGEGFTEEACEEDERCEEESECQARVCATFTDSQEHAILEFVKEHPELYDKEHAHFHDRQRKEALWAEISAELKHQPFDVRRWFESQRTHYGKLSVWPSPKGDNQETCPGSTSIWVSLRPTSDARGPTEALGSRPVPTPAGIKNLVDLLLIQNI